MAGLLTAQLSTCTWCGQQLAFLVPTTGGLPRAVCPRVYPATLLPAPAWPAKPADEELARTALTPDGRWARLTSDGAAGDCSAHVLHRATCPVLRERRAAEAAGVRAPRPPRVGECDRARGGCGARILWLVTAAHGRDVPVDPEPHHGVVLDAEQARQLKGKPELVRGYAITGEQLAIREGGQADLLEAAAGERREATVWVTHWATCPNREQLRAAMDARRARR